MDNDKLHALAKELGDTIEKYGIEYEKFAINITITEAYFDAVKEILHSDSPPELQAFTEIDEEWTVTLIRPMQLRKKSED